MPAGQLGQKLLRQMAFEFVVDNFVDNFVGVSDVQEFGVLDITAMEEIVSCETLMVRSELDVLQAIILWFTAHYERSVGMADNLAIHIRIDGMNVDDMREVWKVAQNWKLAKLAERCRYVFFNVVSVRNSLQASTSIPPDLRVIHERSAVVQSVTHRFHNIRSWTNGNDYYSDWMRDSGMGQKLRLRIRLEQDEQHQLQVGFYVLPNRLLRSNMFSTRYPVQYFVLDISHETFYSIYGEVDHAELGTGFQKFMPFREFQQLFIKENNSDSVAFGVTFYASKTTYSICAVPNLQLSCLCISCRGPASQN